jgi:hypothetical protein
MTRRLLFAAGNVCAAAALLLIVIDPVSNRYVIFALAGACVVLAYVMPRFIRPKEK